MDTDSKAILEVQVVDKREVGLKSVNMEKEALQRGLNHITSNLSVKEMVTDAHVQVTAMLSKYTDHWFAINMHIVNLIHKPNCSFNLAFFRE